MPHSLKLVAISDTHGMHRAITVPDGDVLVHSGDFCRNGNFLEVRDFVEWLSVLPHKHKIVTAGNHDKAVAKRTRDCRALFKEHGVHLLLNEEVVIDGIKFWGSPVTPTFFEWSFMLDRGKEIASVWRNIPDDVDVLITHGPPYGNGDLAPAYRTSYPKSAGCLDLLIRLREIKKATQWRHPQVHIFGHIHSGHGSTQSDEFGSLVFVNAAICTEQYRPTNNPASFTVREVTHGKGKDSTGKPKEDD